MYYGKLLTWIRQLNRVFLTYGYMTFKIFRKIFLIFLALLILNPFIWGMHTASAQEENPDAPVYIVQKGDSLWDIALRFGVTMDALARANSISDTNQLSVGDQLVIPGLEGVQGVLTAVAIPYGETLNSLSRRYRVSVETITKLNHLTSTKELYAGRSLIIPEQSADTTFSQRASIPPDYSLLELSVLQGSNPWTFVLQNALPGTWGALPGDVLHILNDLSTENEINEEGHLSPGALPEAISEIILDPLPMVQGKADVIKILGINGLSISGSLAGYELQFLSEKKGEYVSLQGIHAMTDPGLYPLNLTITLPEDAPYYGATYSFSQPVYIKSGGYAYDPVLIVSPETIDPAVTKPEDAQWQALATPITTQKLWDGIFKSPTPPEFSDCWPSLFGNRRSYNGSAYGPIKYKLKFFPISPYQTILLSRRSLALSRSAVIIIEDFLCAVQLTAWYQNLNLTQWSDINSNNRTRSLLRECDPDILSFQHAANYLGLKMT